MVLKLISLLAAIVLWLIVSGERDTEWSYLVPLKLKNLPQDMIVTNNVPEFIDVRLQGPRSFMQEITPQQMKVEINLADLKLGSNIHPLTPDQIKVPRGINITRINPSYLSLEAERLLKKEVRVKGETRGNPATDFVVESVEVMPAAVEIMGPEKETRNIIQLKTGVVDITGINSDLSKEVAIDKGGQNIRFSKDEPVVVSVKVRELTKKLELKKVAIKLQGGNEKMKISPTSVTILLEGPKSLIDHVRKEKTAGATINAEKLLSGEHTVAVEINVPEGIRVLYSNPKEVTLTVPK